MPSNDNNNLDALLAELKRHRFIAALDDAIRPLTAPDEIAHTVATILGRHLGVQRCAYAWVDDALGLFTLTGNYTDGLRSIVGQYALADFGAEFVRLHRAGLPYVVDDADSDARVADVIQAYRETGIRAVVSVPVVKAGRLVAGMAVHTTTPRRWHDHEVRLLAAVAQRCWESVERGRIGIALRKAEERVRASHDYLRLLLDCTEEGFYSVDRDGVTVMCNAAFLKMLGFQREEDAIGKKLHDVIHHSHPDGAHYPVVDCPIYRAARDGEAAHVQDEMFFRQDGSAFPVEYRARPVWQDGRLQGAVCTFVDLTDRRRTERALRDSEAHLRSLFDQSAGGICETDLQGRIVRLNDRYCQIVGRTRDDLLGRRMQDLTHPDDVAANLVLFEQAIASGEPFEIEKRYVRPDGSLVWVNNTVNLIHAAGGGSVPTMLAISVDISKRKRAEDALRDADRRKDEFLAMLAHELRNPMAPIRAAADLLATTQLDAERLRRTSQIVSRQVGHMTGLVDDLLDVSRVTRGLVELERRNLDMKQVIADAIEQSRPLMEAKTHRLTVELAPEPAHVMGDQKRLVQILTNLLNNAAKYTPAAGCVRVAMQTSATQVILAVEDNGTGIDLELQPRIFDLFTQADRSADRSQGGLGIGLALVKSLVELHGGAVRVDSSGPGQGSRFTITLPRVAGPSAPADDSNLLSTTKTARRRVLLVDDNADAAHMLAMFLEMAGHEVAIEYGPHDALARAQAMAAHVCILDIGLPDMDGYELARRLRQLPGTSGAMLVALTGYGREEDRRKALQAGFDHHLVKPVSAETLLALFALAPE